MTTLASSTYVLNKKYLYFIAYVASIGGIFFGFDAGIISSAILFIRNDFHLTAFADGLVIGSLMFGGLIGTLVAEEVSNVFGRKKIILLSAIIFAIGELSSACAIYLWGLIAGRIIAGFAIGILSIITPFYITEVAPENKRNMLLGIHQVFIMLGVFFAYIITYFCALSENWRVMLQFGFFPALVLFLCALFIPESPYWLLQRNREQEAASILEQLGFGAGMLAWIKTNLADSRGDWHMLFKQWLLPAAVVVLGLAVFQQFMGIGVIIYYAPTLFVLAGFRFASNAILATLGLSIFAILFTLLAMLLIKRWRRRIILLVGLAGMALALLFLYQGFAFLHQMPITAGWLLLFGVILYLLCFCLSIGPVLWLIAEEIFPPRIRGLAVNVTLSAHWACNMVVVATFLVLVQFFKPQGVFLIYAVMAILGFIFVYFLMPETKDVSSEVIEANLRAGRKSRDLGNANGQNTNNLWGN